MQDMRTASREDAKQDILTNLQFGNLISLADSN